MKKGKYTTSGKKMHNKREATPPGGKMNYGTEAGKFPKKSTYGSAQKSSGRGGGSHSKKMSRNY